MMESGKIDGKRSGDVYKAAASMLGHTMGDRQKQVFMLAQEFLRFVLGPYAAKKAPSNSELAGIYEVVMPALLVKCCDSVPRTREAAVELVVWLSQLPLTKTSAAFYGPLYKPMPAKVAFKEAQGRLEVVAKTVDAAPSLKASGAGLSLEKAMGFAVPLLKHARREARDAAIAIVVACYRHAGSDVNRCDGFVCLLCTHATGRNGLPLPSVLPHAGPPTACQLRSRLKSVDAAVRKTIQAACSAASPREKTATSPEDAPKNDVPAPPRDEGGDATPARDALPPRLAARLAKTKGKGKQPGHSKQANPPPGSPSPAPVPAPAPAPAPVPAPVPAGQAAEAPPNTALVPESAVHIEAIRGLQEEVSRLRAEQAKHAEVTRKLASQQESASRLEPPQSHAPPSLQRMLSQRSNTEMVLQNLNSMCIFCGLVDSVRTALSMLAAPVLDHMKWPRLSLTIWSGCGGLTLCFLGRV